ncbi:hypothetical protein K9L27_04040 [Candidatus Gracilibacteria bacterium]|nr:hypothetical protein [Candidatus Gracilibacteria bacterium]
MENQKNTINEAFNPGKEIFSWTACNYHPHKRGWLWLTIFCIVFFGSAVLMLFQGGGWGDKLASATFLLALAMYFYVHKQGNEDHEVRVTERAVFIDNKLISLEKLSGYWFVYDETASLLNLQFENKRRDQKIILQMGNQTPDFFRKNFARVDLLELEDKKEGLLDLWIRALKL